MADIPTLPAYPGAYWFWHKNLPVCGTGHPTPGFWNFAHFSQSSKMFSIHIIFLQYFRTSGLKISKVGALTSKNLVYNAPFLIGNVF